MARQRVVDPMAAVEAVSRRALGVATQAEVDATAGELQRYRDTDEARREAPVVTGSTADGTALAAVIAALQRTGAVVDATETVADEVTTGTVTADIVNVIGLTATSVQVTREFTMTSVEDDDGMGSSYNIGDLAVRNFDDSLTMMVMPSAAYTSLQTINDRALVLYNGAQLGMFTGDGTSPEVPTFLVDGVTGATTVAGTLDVDGTATFGGRVNLLSSNGAPTGSSNGDIYYHSGRHQLAADTAASNTAIVWTNNASTLSDTIDTTAAETAFSRTYAIPADALVAGRTMRVVAFGTYGRTATPTLNIRLKLAGPTTTVTLFASGNITLSADGSWLLEAVGRFSNTQFVHHAGLQIGPSTATPEIRQDTGSVTVTDGYAVTQTVTVTADWSASSASNTVTLSSLIVDMA